MRTPIILSCALLMAACAAGGGASPWADGAVLLMDAGAVDLDAAVPSGDADAAGDAATDGEPTFRFDAAPPDLGPPDVLRHLWVTVNDIPEAMRGLEPGRVDGARSTFAWALPEAGWTIEVYAENGGAWEPPAEAPYLLWRAIDVDQPRHVIEPAHVAPAGGRWERVESGHRWQGRVVTPPPGEPGRFTLQAAVAGTTTDLVTVLRRELTPELDPFVEVDPWFVTFSRDRGRLEVSAAGDGFAVTSVAEPDGRPDFDEAVEALGLLGGDDAWDAEVLRQLREAVRAHLHAFYLLRPDGTRTDDSVRIRFVFEGDADAPEDAAAAGFSVIAVGGEDAEWRPGGRTFFGRAAIDWNNQAVDDNTAPDRGVFTTSFVRFVLANRVTVTLLRDYLPAAGGQPFGSLPSDADFLDADFDPNQLEGQAEIRALRFRFALDTLALAMASVLAHEIGHSLGLVKPGLPPEGLLAGVDGPWVSADVDGAHIDTEGFNLMQSGTSFSLADVASSTPAFNALNRAYLQRRLVVGP